jgi:DNA-directed RNA polymerase specialized sigma54-like protein
MLKQSLQLKLGQSLTMTPQLQQAIRLLQMPTLELQQHISELLETNVMLEQEEPEEEVELTTSIKLPSSTPTSLSRSRLSINLGPIAPERAAMRDALRTTRSASAMSPTSAERACATICSINSVCWVSPKKI